MLASRPVLALSLALLVWLALPGAFVFDDHSLFVNPAVVAPDAWRYWVAPAQTRPLTYATFWMDYQIWGANAAGFRFTNLLIHLAAEWLVFLCARRLWDEETGCAAAVLFALHPLTHEPLLYVFARSSSLAAVFGLAAIWFWLTSRRWAAVVWFAVSLLAKEEWVAVPFAVAAIDWGRSRRMEWRPLATMGVCAAAAGARVIYATTVIAGAGSGFGQSTSPWEYFVLQGLAIPGYLGRVFVPVNMTIDPARPEENLEAAIVFWLLLAGAGAYAIWRRLPWPLAGILLLLPSSSVLPAADAVAYRRMYMPMAMFAIAAAGALRKWPRKTLGVAALLAMLGAGRRSDWQSEQAIWGEALAHAPRKVRPYVQLARVSPPVEAKALLDRAREIAPGEAEVPAEMGRVWLESGNAAKALAEFGRALALAPNEPRHMQNRGVALLMLGQAEAARADFVRALAKNPCMVQARENLRKMGVEPPPSAMCSPVNLAEK